MIIDIRRDRRAVHAGVAAFDHDTDCNLRIVIGRIGDENTVIAILPLPVYFAFHLRGTGFRSGLDAVFDLGKGACAETVSVADAAHPLVDQVQGRLADV